MVTGDNVALLIHAQATISIAVISETNIQTLLHYKLLQALDMGRASIVVDVSAVGLCIDYIGVCAQRIKHRLGDVPARAVGTIQTNLHALEGVDTERDQVSHIAVTACHIVHRAADVFPVSKRQLRPVLIKHMEFAVNVVLYQQQSFLRHFFAIAVDQLDAVVVVGVVAGRDHDAAVEIIHPGDVGHRRRSSDVEQISICTRCRQASDQTVFEHIRTTTGVLADDNACRFVIAVTLTQSIVIPTQKTTNLVGMVSGQSDSSFTTEAIGSKILSHYNFSSSKE